MQCMELDKQQGCKARGLVQKAELQSIKQKNQSKKNLFKNKVETEASKKVKIIILPCRDRNPNKVSNFVPTILQQATALDWNQKSFKIDGKKSRKKNLV